VGFGGEELLAGGGGAFLKVGGLLEHIHDGSALLFGDVLRLGHDGGRDLLPKLGLAQGSRISSSGGNVHVIIIGRGDWEA